MSRLSRIEAAKELARRCAPPTGGVRKETESYSEIDESDSVMNFPSLPSLTSFISSPTTSISTFTSTTTTTSTTFSSITPSSSFTSSTSTSLVASMVSFFNSSKSTPAASLFSVESPVVSAASLPTSKLVPSPVPDTAVLPQAPEPVSILAPEPVSLSAMKTAVVEKQAKETIIISTLASIVDKLAVRYAPFRHMPDPFPQVNWHALARPNWKDPVGLPRPVLFPKHGCNFDPKIPLNQTFPHGSELGYQTSLGIVAMPKVSVNGYSFSIDTNSWIISASPPQRLRGCRGGRRTPRRWP